MGVLIIPSSSSCAWRETHTRAGGSTSAGNSFATETMVARSATNSRQWLQAATCARASSGRGARPSCSTANSTSLHCMTLHSAEAGAGCLPRSTSLKSFRRKPWCFAAKSLTQPPDCAHCSSIIMRRLSFCRMAYFPCLLADLFLEQVPQTCARLVQLRLRISHRASHDVRDLVVFVPLDVMQYEHGPVARRQLLNRSFQIDPVDGATQAQVRRADVLPGAARFIIGIRRFFERGHWERLLSQPHQHYVDRHPVQPGREGRLPAEGPNLAEKLQKSFLHQVFRIGGVIHHAQAQCVDAAAMQVVQKLKSRSISGLGQTDGLRFSHRFGGLPRGRRFGIAWSSSGQRSNSGASTSSDAPNTPLSCPVRSPHVLNRHPLRGAYSRARCPVPCGRAGLIILPRLRSQTQSPSPQRLGAIRTPSRTPCSKNGASTSPAGPTPQADATAKPAAH